jgi:hypothetical protein
MLKKFGIFLIIVVIIAAAYYSTSKPKASQYKYPALTAEVIRDLPDADLDYSIVDHVGYLIGDDYENEYKIVMALPKEMRAVYTTWWVEAEVGNGGFNQYFWNSTGQFRHEAVQGYELIGANEHASLLREAIAVYEKEEARLKQYKDKNSLEGFSESYKDNPLNQFDERFFKLDDANAMRANFIRKNMNAFRSHK